ncbi:hypothetical protein GCM10022222_49410 [Amycolatopsis ultiminotia]|uniref:DUF5666 domain-containing protein n=1 Tax=Amycolatopsis ultiminotia TaxID=543629 RepID=A0ABP6X109_9PSEU
MTTPHPSTATPDHPPAWGDLQPPAERPARAKWIAGGIAAVIVFGGGGAVWAATSSSSSTADSAQSGPGGQAGGPGGGGGAELGSALHGEFVSAGDSGTYVTKFLQTGQVTALSSTSLTAKSTDGFTKTYTIDASTATGIKQGEDVTVVATENGSKATVTSATEARTAGGMNGAPPANGG